MKKITIAIDGYSSCGKSTLARQLAKELNYIFIDSGAMYRSVTLFAIKNGAIKDNTVYKARVLELLDSIDLEFKLSPSSKAPEIYMNGKNVEHAIRTLEVSSMVSQIATIEEVREKLVTEQRKMGKNGGIVMDGRDIGSVVFPDAELKIFVTADIETRVERRFSELSSKGISNTKEEVRNNLIKRDRIDSTRAISPLTQTEDAIVIDNTDMDRDQQLQYALELVDSTILAH